MTMFDLQAMIGEENLQRGKWWGKSWNVTSGCSYESTGCTNCYARSLHNMRFIAYTEGKTIPDCYSQTFGEVRCLPERLELPLHWRKPQVVFVDSMSDLFHEDVPDAFIEAVFGMMSVCGQHFFIICTKRARRMQAWFQQHSLSSCQAELCVPGKYSWGKKSIRDHSAINSWPLPNVMLMVTAENQETADERIPLLLATPAKWRGISAEPLLDSLDLTPYLPGLSWILTGCESGPNRRPTSLVWLQLLANQCQSAVVPYFCKQAVTDSSGLVVHAPYAEWLQLPEVGR